MVYRFIIIIATVFYLSACTSSNVTQSSSKEGQIQDVFVEKYPISANAKLFLNQIQGDMAQKNQELNNYTPSTAIIDKYALRTNENGVFVSGFIKVNEEFSAEDLTKAEVKLGSKKGEIRTVHLPLKSLPILLQADNITYFEISGTAKINE